VPGFSTGRASSSGEQVRAGLREADEGAAVVEFKPAAFNSEREARRILCRCASIDVQERAVELFDVDASVLHHLEGVRVSASVGALPSQDQRRFCGW
jgi:hypothetical protein